MAIKPFILTQYADVADSTEERDKQDFFQKLYKIYCCARFLVPIV